MKHTPGPWMAVEKKSQTEKPLICIQRKNPAKGGIQSLIAILPDRCPNPAQWKSNSGLIVAAPEMFDVLEKLVHGPAHKLYETVAEAHKILKRIKGEE